MRETAIKISKELHDRADHCAVKAGYSSTQEFITHVLENEISRLEEEAPEREKAGHKLQGIGYLDAGLDI
jgi:hypothetical protein